jgi:CBS domain-containing protein
MPKVIEIASTPPSLSPDDPIGKAAEVLRRSSCNALPVVEGGCVIGMVYEDDVFNAVSFAENKKIRMDEPSTMRVCEIMRTRIPTINVDTDVEEAINYFMLTGLPALPVTDENGLLHGVVSRADVASAMCGALRPVRVAGMSTPLGIYLTCGTHRGGVGDIGLFLTGSLMGLLLVLSQGLVKFIFHIIDTATNSNLLSLYLDASGLPTSNSIPISVGALGLLLQIFLFFVLLRFLPLSGWHGAEHKVVHAIERGEMLLFERVEKMPRVHPRCGTNFVAIILLLLSVYIARPSIFVLAGLVTLVLLTWRRLGMLLQALLTTREPSRRQLERAIEAGTQLLKRYQSQPGLKPHPLKVIWNMGFIQALSGFAVIQLLCWLYDFIMYSATVGR